MASEWSDGQDHDLGSLWAGAGHVLPTIHPAFAPGPWPQRQIATRPTLVDSRSDSHQATRRSSLYLVTSCSLACCESSERSFWEAGPQSVQLPAHGDQGAFGPLKKIASLQAQGAQGAFGPIKKSLRSGTHARNPPKCFLIHTVTTPTLASTGMTPILDQSLRARSRRRRSRARESGSSQGYTQPTTHEAPRPPIRGRLGQPIPSRFSQTISSKVGPTSLWPKQVVVSQ